MIQSNELRRGNKVTDEFYESFGTIITVESINDKGINLEIVDDGNWPECATRWIEPEYKFGALFGIPLTPEVLEKCGFEKDEQHECYVISQDDEHELAFHYDSNVVLLSVGDNFAMQLDHIKHLHQLQNIVHALTGTELEYKP